MEIKKTGNDKLVIIERDKSNTPYIIGGSFFLFALWMLYIARDNPFFGVLVAGPSILIGIMIIKANFCREIEIDNNKKEIHINSKIFNVNKTSVIKLKLIEKAIVETDKENSCYYVCLKLKNGADFRLFKDNDNKNNLSEITNFINYCIAPDNKQMKTFKFQ